MSKIYEFGFLDDLVGINFPSGAKILALDCSYACPYLGSDFEAFGLSFPSYFPAFGVPYNGNTGNVMPALPTQVLIAGKAPLPKVVDPVSSAMQKQLFVWERPASIPRGQSLVGEATVFINLSLAAAKADPPGIVSFNIGTAGHPVIFSGSTDTRTGYIAASLITEGPDTGNYLIFVVNRSSPFVPPGHGVPFVSSMSADDILFWAKQPEPPFFFALSPAALASQLAFLNGSGSTVWVPYKVIIPGEKGHPISGGTTWKIIASTYQKRTKFPLTSAGGLISIQGNAGNVVVTGGAVARTMLCSVQMSTLGVTIK